MDDIIRKLQSVQTAVPGSVQAFDQDECKVLLKAMRLYAAIWNILKS